jgi:DNA-directed RNA polymerase specialized sigma24 family protein
MVERALALLPPHQREIIILRDIEGMENEEIAAVLEWTAKPGAIRKRVFDAREAFRRAMLSIGYNER